ncbi:hypothetical protein ACS0TY_003562 [Phlomoides rotata]
MYVKGKDLWDHLDGTIPAPKKGVDFVKWASEDAKVVSWILASIETHMINNLRSFSPAKEMWDYLGRIYYQDHDARHFQLELGLADSDDEAAQAADLVVGPSPVKKKRVVEPQKKKKVSNVVLEDDEEEGYSAEAEDEVEAEAEAEDDSEESTEDQVPIAKRLKLTSTVSKSLLQQFGVPQGAPLQVTPISSRAPTSPPRPQADIQPSRPSTRSTTTTTPTLSLSKLAKFFKRTPVVANLEPAQHSSPKPTDQADTQLDQTIAKSPISSPPKSPEQADTQLDQNPVLISSSPSPIQPEQADTQLNQCTTPTHSPPKSPTPTPAKHDPNTSSSIATQMGLDTSLSHITPDPESHPSLTAPQPRGGSRIIKLGGRSIDNLKLFCT